MKELILLFAGILMLACHTTKHEVQSLNLKNVEQLAKEKYEDNYFVINNNTKRYSLVKSKTKKFSELGFDINFMVIDNQTMEVILEEFLKSGFVEWQDTYTLKVVSRNIAKGNKRIKEVYTYNVQDRVKTNQ